MLSPSSEHREVLELTHVSKTFRQRNTAVPALVDVDLQLAEGETLGIVGESGSGKSTLAKAMLGIEPADEGGAVQLDGHTVAKATIDRQTAEKRAMQMVFQNPDSALNRSWSVRRILIRSVEKLTGVKGKEANDRVEALAASLRLTPRHLDLKPRQLSGGLKQRVAIARAFARLGKVLVTHAGEHLAGPRLTAGQCREQWHAAPNQNRQRAGKSRSIGPAHERADHRQTQLPCVPAAFD